MVTGWGVLREGLGESAAFYQAHPLLNLTYFTFVVGMTMFSMHPAFLLASFVLAWCYSILLRGLRAIRFNCLVMLPLTVVLTLINTLNVHNGVTVLFYLNDNRVTLEALAYGLASAVMLTSVIIWFSCFNTVVTSDKLIYLFGRVAPVLGLTLSMILRYIPLLQRRFREVSAAQRCMGRGGKGTPWWGRARQFVKELSILIAWSLEASIESADSMEARGYGLRGRTSFHLFRFAGGERWLLAAMLALGLTAAAACVRGDTTIYYYPTIQLPPFSGAQWVGLAAYLVLMLLPVILDLRGMRRWN
jgi:energy-coupling factor transport system permease protein